MVNTNEQLITQIEEAGIVAYQDASILGYFPAKPIGHIGIENWIHKKLDDIPEAALTAAGFNPSDAAINPQTVSFAVFTVSEKIKIVEKDWEAFQNWGLDEDAITMLGKKIGIMASLYLMIGQDEAAASGSTPITQYNFIRDAGSANGTLARPNMAGDTATAGVWSTYANKSTDLSLLEAQLVQRGYNLASTVIFYPQCAHKPMTLRGNAAKDLSARDYLLEDGLLDVISIPNQYCYTKANALPTAALFDLIAIDLSQIDIGYTREERVRTILAHHDVRDTIVEGEVWFCPWIVPRPMLSGITPSVFKGVSRISAIQP